MKKTLLSFSLLSLVAAAANAEVATETAVFDFTTDALHIVGEGVADPAGAVYNEVFDVDGVSLQVISGSASSKVANTGAKGTCLVMYKEYGAITVTAPLGKALTKIVFTSADTKTTDFKLEAETAPLTYVEGSYVDGTSFPEFAWEGNAECVRFKATLTPYIKSVVVSYADKDETTAAYEPLTYTEVGSIAEFNALEAGTLAKLTLTDAEVIGFSADGFSTAFIQDATAGTQIQYSSLVFRLLTNTKVSGTVYAVVRKTSGNTQIKDTEDTPSSELLFTASHELTVTDCESLEDVAANYGKVVRISGATLTATTVKDATLSFNGETIAVANGTATANQQLHAVEDFTAGETLENVTLVGVVVGKSTTALQLLPLSVEQSAITQEAAIEAQPTVDAQPVYSLNGRVVGAGYRGIVVKGGKLVWQK